MVETKPIGEMLKNCTRHTVTIRFGVYHSSFHKREVANIDVSEELFSPFDKKYFTPTMPSVEYSYELTKNLAGWKDFEKNVLDELLEVDGTQFSLNKKNVVKFLKDSAFSVTADYTNSCVFISRRSLEGSYITSISIRKEDSNWTTSSLLREDEEDIFELLSLFLIDGEPLIIPETEVKH